MVDYVKLNTESFEFNDVFLILTMGLTKDGCVHITYSTGNTRSFILKRNSIPAFEDLFEELYVKFIDMAESGNALFMYNPLENIDVINILMKHTLQLGINRRTEIKLGTQAGRLSNMYKYVIERTDDLILLTRYTIDGKIDYVDSTKALSDYKDEDSWKQELDEVLDCVRLLGRLKVDNL